MIPRAACPACARALPRSGYFGGWTVATPCPYCGAPIRKVPSVEWIGNVIVGVVLAVATLLGLGVGGAVGSVAGAVVGGAAGFIGVSVLGWVLYPWGTRFERADPGTRCATCGYDLRATPARCPECGTVVPPPAT